MAEHVTLFLLRTFIVIFATSSKEILPASHDKHFAGKKKWIKWFRESIWVNYDISLA
jgi:hypothetical protein